MNTPCTRSTVDPPRYARLTRARPDAPASPLAPCPPATSDGRGVPSTPPPANPFAPPRQSPRVGGWLLTGLDEALRLSGQQSAPLSLQATHRARHLSRTGLRPSRAALCSRSWVTVVCRRGVCRHVLVVSARPAGVLCLLCRLDRSVMSVMCTACLHPTGAAWLAAGHSEARRRWPLCQGGRVVPEQVARTPGAKRRCRKSRRTNPVNAALRVRLGAPGECHDEVAEVVDVQPGARRHNRR